jgi:hypothetical protein
VAATPAPEDGPQDREEQEQEEQEAEDLEQAAAEAPAPAVAITGSDHDRRDAAVGRNPGEVARLEDGAAEPDRQRGEDDDAEDPEEPHVRCTPFECVRGRHPRRPICDSLWAAAMEKV